MIEVKMQQVDQATFNSLPTAYGVPLYFTLGGNGQIKIWPQPSQSVISAGLKLHFELTSNDPSALSPTP